MGVALTLQFVLSPLGFDELGVDLLLQLVQLSSHPAHLALLAACRRHGETRGVRNEKNLPAILLANPMTSQKKIAMHCYVWLLLS